MDHADFVIGFWAGAMLVLLFTAASLLHRRIR
jgi:hypothetical protein